MLRVLFFVAVMTGAAVAQEGTALDDDKRRFLLPNQVNPKSSRCTGFDYYLEPARANGTQFVDRQYYVRTIPTRLRVQCAPGTLFSIAADICVCSTHIRPAFLFNRDRCVTITGSVQDSKRFNLVQRGEAGSRDVSVSGYESIVRTQDNCFGSNTTVFRALDYLRGNSVSRRDFEMSIGFRVPSGVGAGREFQIFGTSPCSGDSRQGSLVITYVTAAFNQLPILTASFLVRDKTAALGSPETTASIQCTIPQSVSGNAQQQYFWDPQDPTNEVTVTVDMDNFSTLSMTLANSQMRTNGAPVGGFCQNNVVNSPLGARGGGKMISERNCAAFFGKAPGNDYMCIYQEIVTSVEAVTMNGRSINITGVAMECDISHGSVCKIIHAHLEMPKVCARCTACGDWW